MTDFLTVEDLWAAAEAALGRPPEVGDWGLLEGAVGRPQATVFGEDEYPGLAGKAAALLHSMCTTQPLIDGNKRTGWVAMRLFYLLNGRDIRVAEDEAYDFVLDVAEGRLVGVEKIAERLRLWEVPAASART